MDLTGWLGSDAGTQVELSLQTDPIPRPGKDQILVRVEASPINPSDLGGLLAGMDMDTAVASEDNVGNPVIRGKIPRRAFEAMRARDGVPLHVGNEGAGVVSAVGIDSGEAAMDLLGKTVAILGGSMYSQYRVVDASQVLPLLPDTTPAEGAAAFVNPLTVLGMIETMRDEGHTAIVHTAAASQLGQMLVRACCAEGIPLVNIVRRPEQISLLAGLGAEHIVDSSSEEFHDDLVSAISASVSRCSVTLKLSDTRCCFTSPTSCVPTPIGCDPGL
jgi:NADPH:quinone reductase-like Zn-dependent oxidoreductase